ncbi:MAG TPA: sugar ABC transporter ATP-binding protein [Acetobacteraceae bacterium]|nr:sugar ABC transporter ATP-binding protein [Acetobacteraceae bacterium]
MADSPLLSMRGIGKSFGAVPVLRDVDLTLHAGEVLALMGENGAGKSTLMKILGAIYPDHDGQITINNQPVALESPRAAAEAGIAFIHQELNLVAGLTVAGNIFLGREPRRAGLFIDEARMGRDCAALLRRLGFRLDPGATVGSLRVGEQQLVEIAKALSLDARILIMDEPTSALSQTETEALFRVVRGLAEQGVAIIYITHRMEEVFRVADRVMVLRDGAAVGELAAAGAPRRELIRLMIGRDVADFFATHRRPAGELVMEVEDLWLEQPGRAIGRSRTLDGVSFSIRAGEILGIGGLLGSGRTELLETLFGAAEGRSGGRIRIDGKPVTIRSPAEAKRAGIALVSEDRRREGLVMLAGLDANVALPTQPALATAGVISRRRELDLAAGTIRRLGIRAAPVQSVATLSGGNQQKVVFGKWLPTEPRVLLLDEPTRGIDVGAKAEIYQLLAELAAAGLAVIMVSSELPELLSQCDRILVLREGRPTALLDRNEFSAERVLAFASPGYAAAGGSDEQYQPA